MKNMKYIESLCIVILLLCSSCDKEEWITSLEKQQQIPFEIEVSINRPNTETRVDTNPEAPQEPGTCTVNRIKILVFKADGVVDNTVANMDKFIYEINGTITDQPNTVNGKYKAKGYFTAQEGASYRIIALAYLDTDEQYLNIANNDFTGKNYKEVTISLKENGGKYKAPEFFKGVLRNEAAISDVISGSGETSLKGFLYRAIGRTNIEINNIPDEVTKLEFAVDRYSITNYLHDENGLYIGNPALNAILVGERVLAETTEFTDEGTTKGKTAYFSADMLRLAPNDMGSIFYIKATQNGASNTYIIMSDDQWIYTDYVGILEKVITSNRFIVPTNYQLNVHGNFSALKAGNILIEYSDEITDSVQIGILINK